ncbi:MAG: oligosaccharide flippase family protein [Methanomicrobia archaeon]|nr:oligosaccharide flippase family protein [Methanomicrobia archaeon]
MRIWLPKNREEVKQHVSDPLFKNAYFLMLSSVTSAGSGFFFWLIAARFYSAEAVGLASALIAAMGLISTLSLLGFDISLVRFIPERAEKNELINSCLTISFFVALALTVIFIAGLGLWSPSLRIIKEHTALLLLFIVFTVLAPLGALQSQGVFVGFRTTKYSLYQTVVTFARLGVVPFLVAYGAVGIYAASGVTSVLAVGLGLFLTSRLVSGYKPRPRINRDVIAAVFRFSAGNYIARLFEALPGVVLPLLVVNILGPEKNAYFFIAWATVGLLLVIPGATAKSLLTEGSYSRAELSRNTRRAVKFIALLLGAAIIGIVLLGRYVLWLFGEAYVQNSFEVLAILALGSVPVALNTIYTTIKRVQKELMPVILVSGGTALLTLLGSYLLIQRMGVIGVGIAWVLGNGIVACGVGLVVMKGFRRG